MPRIKTTRTVTIALFLLRIYLLVMLLIILAKFIMEARGRGGHEGGPPAGRENPNVEIRNPKQTQITKYEGSNSGFEISGFEISDLRFPI